MSFTRADRASCGSVPHGRRPQADRWSSGKKRGAEGAVVRIEGPEATRDIEPALDLGKGIDRLTEVGCEAVLGEPGCLGGAVHHRQGLVERGRYGAIEPAVAFHFVRDTGRPVRHDNTGERTERTALGIKRRQPTDQVGQQFLANVSVIGRGKAELPDQPASHNVGFVLDDLEIGRGDLELHRAVPRHRVLMTGRCPCSGLETCPEPLLNLS